MAVECYIIPKGQQAAYYRQYGKLNRIVPLELKTGEWIIPAKVGPMLKQMYVDLKTDKARFDKRVDATLAVCDYAEATIGELSRLSKRMIDLKDLHDRYLGDEAIIDPKIIIP